MGNVDATAVRVVPWYARKDFEELKSQRCGEPWPGSYEEWLDDAFQNMRQLLSRGCALTIVTIHVDDYFAWLSQDGDADSEVTRRRYIEQLARLRLRPLDWSCSTTSDREFDAR